MSENQADQVSALAKRVDQLEESARAVVASVRRASAMRVYITILLFLVVGGFITLYVTRVQSFTSKQDELLAALQERAQANSPDIVKHLQKLAENALPQVQESMTDQFSKDAPAIMKALGEQRDVMAENLQEKVVEHVNDEYERWLEDHNEILIAEFPDLKDDALRVKIADNFKLAMGPIAAKHYGNRMDEELQRMYQIWDDFPQSDFEGSSDQMADELTKLLFEIMRMKLANLDEVPSLSAGTD